MIDWPAVLKSDGDDELTYIDSATAWHRDAGTYVYHHNDGNILIDSSARVFDVSRGTDGTIAAEDTGSAIALDDFIRLVRIHASSSHRCCIEKIGFRTVAEGIRLVAAMDEDDR